jgi:catechol 2,3-dioxygenase-like lactoylglutathione lyase family enzyme
MQTSLGHILFNVRSQNLSFYRDLLSFLGWDTIFGNDEMLGVRGNGDTSLWFSTAVNDAANDYDGAGMNHFAISTGTQADVDATVDYLRAHGVTPLFETPRHRPEFSGEGQTYYQVMFESPDRILIEVVYTGPVAA